ncbi:MAG: Hpt domain-containing protein [Bacteroidaceae bacterium]|nr:Hpt domain-containing protein [Bacteroidaceae bacterium]
MTIQECYQAMGANFDDAVSRLMKPELVQKYALRFLDEHSFDDLKPAFEAKDYGAAFKAAHTFKGVCLNLSLDQLSKPMENLTNALREGSFDPALAESLYPEVENIYNNTIRILASFKEELN